MQRCSNRGNVHGKSRFREFGREYRDASNRDGCDYSRERRISRHPVQRSKDALAGRDSDWLVGFERGKELSHEAKRRAYARAVDYVPGMRQHV